MQGRDLVHSPSLDFLFCKTERATDSTGLLWGLNEKTVKISEVHVWRLALRRCFHIPFLLFLLPPLLLSPHLKDWSGLLNHMVSAAVFKKPVILTVCHALLTLNYIPPNMDSLAGEHDSSYKNTDDMKMSFQKWLKCVWISFFRFIHDAELRDGQMESVKLSIYLYTRVISVATRQPRVSCWRRSPVLEPLLSFPTSIGRTVDKYFQVY